MHTKRFTSEGLERFAAFSGDYNPLHLDASAARRATPGRVIVHGIYLLLTAMDVSLGSEAGRVRIKSLSARFEGTVPPEEEIEVRVGERNRAVRLEIFLTSTGAKAAVFEVAYVETAECEKVGVWGTTFRPAVCSELSPEEFEGRHGELDIACDLDIAVTLFPNLARILPPDQLAMLASTSRLVGMSCPGAHSVYASVRLGFDETQTLPRRCGYRVERYDPRFSSLRIGLDAPGAEGEIVAFHRPPHDQPGIEEVRSAVAEDEFVGQRALVLGGSRGLGELCAKILAAGGAEVLLSYRLGKADAARVVDEITEAGGKASAIQLCVPDEPHSIADRLASKRTPTHLYYFATPPIAAARRGAFTYSLFKDFCDCYLAGLLSVLAALDEMKAELRGVFFPSSVFVAEGKAEMAEYAAAKAAGEQLLRFLAASRPELMVATPRLPMLPTDQTAGAPAAQKTDAIPIIIPLLRSVHVGRR